VLCIAARQASLLTPRTVSPTVKHLFKGFDVTIFAYGVTGTGKTHTMRGGKSLQDRGVIPRLLSSIYRRARKVEKDSAGESSVHVSMSYYEIYNDKVFDLFEAPDKRTPAGLPIRDNEKGKAIVVGLTERPCTSLKEFEQLYDQANVNRSTSATKLNAHSSRSHAILCVKVSQTTGDQVRVSTVSAIDLAGSEDNRRTDNNKERLVESSAINKSLFVLAQCVEAISKNQTRIPYRESKMTRILALGQNKSHTIMVLNLAPVKSYHLDTMSSLNFANRTKKIETNEIENQPFFRDAPGKSKLDGAAPARGPAMNRQPLRPKILSHNSHLKDVVTGVTKPAKTFAVFSDKPSRPAPLANTSLSRTLKPSIKSPKRPNSESTSSLARPSKFARTAVPAKAEAGAGMSQSAIEALIERKVNEALAQQVDSTSVSNPEPLSEEVQKRLDALEKRVGGQENERAEGLQFLLMAKQHQARGENASALRMYQLAMPHFPGNEKLMRKVVALQDRMRAKEAAAGAEEEEVPVVHEAPKHLSRPATRPIRKFAPADDEDLSYHEIQQPYATTTANAHSDSEEEEELTYRPRTTIRRTKQQKSSRPAAPVTAVIAAADSDEDELVATITPPHTHHQTPRTKNLLAIINSRDVSQIKLLKGVGAKRAEAIANCLCDLELGGGEEGIVASLGELGRIKGVGGKLVENMRLGMAV
jgi:DNA uptake protein ComE-like DNA-binding protein